MISRHEKGLKFSRNIICRIITFKGVNSSLRLGVVEGMLDGSPCYASLCAAINAVQEKFPDVLFLLGECCC